nr:hypothetical protein GCM10020092_039960 [Actinoplanes digitatis]
MTSSLPIGNAVPNGSGTGVPESTDRVRQAWLAYLAGAPVTVELPLDHLRPLERDHVAARVPVPVPPGVRAALADLDTDESTGWLAAFTALLVRYTGDTELVVGVPVGAAQLAVARRILAPPGVTFRDLLSRVEAAEAAANRLVPLPLSEAGELTRPDEMPGTVAPFAIGFVRDDDPGVAADWAGADLTLAVDAEGARLYYDAGLFVHRTAARLAGHLATLLADLVAHPDRPVTRARLVGADERRRLLVDFNDTEVSYADERPWAARIADLARRRPNAPAVRDRGCRLTFAQLDAAANRLAHELRDRGLPDAGRVALYLDRSARRGGGHPRGPSGRCRRRAVRSRAAVGPYRDDGGRDRPGRRGDHRTAARGPAGRARRAGCLPGPRRRGR